MSREEMAVWAASRLVQWPGVLGDQEEDRGMQVRRETRRQVRVQRAM